MGWTCRTNAINKKLLQNVTTQIEEHMQDRRNVSTPSPCMNAVTVNSCYKNANTANSPRQMKTRQNFARAEQGYVQSSWRVPVHLSQLWDKDFHISSCLFCFEGHILVLENSKKDKLCFCKQSYNPLLPSKQFSWNPLVVREPRPSGPSCTHFMNERVALAVATEHGSSWMKSAPHITTCTQDSRRFSLWCGLLRYDAVQSAEWLPTAFIFWAITPWKIHGEKLESMGKIHAVV